jgi:hypothetical protein
LYTNISELETRFRASAGIVAVVACVIATYPVAAIPSANRSGITLLKYDVVLFPTK